MASKKIVAAVVTASSNSGAQAVASLLESGKDVTVRAAFRSAEKAAELTKKVGSPTNLEIVTGVDAEKPDTLAPVFQGADFAVCVTPHADFARDAELTCSMVQAASEAGAHVIFVGSWTVRAPDTTIAKRFVPTEALLRTLDTKWTALRSGYFSGNYAALFKKDAPDVYFPELTVPPVDPADMGRVAAAICLADDPAKHHGQFYDVSGPEELSTAQIVAKVSKATGTTFTYHPVPVDNVPVPFLVELLKDIQKTPLPCSPVTMDIAKEHTSFDTYLANNLPAFSS